jgi:hypothetical protein
MIKERPILNLAILSSSRFLLDLRSHLWTPMSTPMPWCCSLLYLHPAHAMPSHGLSDLLHSFSSSLCAPSPPVWPSPPFPHTLHVASFLSHALPSYGPFLSSHISLPILPTDPTLSTLYPTPNPSSFTSPCSPPTPSSSPLASTPSSPSSLTTSSLPFILSS